MRKDSESEESESVPAPVLEPLRCRVNKHSYNNNVGVLIWVSEVVEFEYDGYKTVEGV